MSSQSSSRTSPGSPPAAAAADRGWGPLALRVGGQSADATYLNGDGFSAPQLRRSGSTVPTWQNLGALARTVPLSVMFDLNLEAHSPAMAAAVASEALKALPAGSLSALEVGNEPDLYPPGLVGNRWNPADQQWAATYGPVELRERFRRLRTALAGAAPGVPLAGPALAGVGSDWFGALMTADRAERRAADRPPLSVQRLRDAGHAQNTHRSPGSSPDQASAGLAASVQNAVATAHQAGLPFRRR